LSEKGALLKDYCIAATSKGLPPQPAYLPESDWYPLNSPLEKQATHDFDRTVNPAISPDLWEQIVTGQATYAIYSVIRYDAGFGQIKRFGFSRQYDPRLTKRRGQPTFGSTTNAGYNYAE
jgi:hypothetical protein